MPDKHLHIVCFDVPYPADYGGVFAVFYKIKALYKCGIKIHLHCYEYGRGQQRELNNYCEEVLYYSRRKGFRGLSATLPYIVNSRRDKKLADNLLKDDYPVLLEGIHCTYGLHKNMLAGKKVFVSLHNVEFAYYKQLSKSANSFFKKIFFARESRLLKKYEQAISSKASFIALSLADKEFYQKFFNANNIKYLPVFLPYTAINAKEGKSSYCLYHGNLSVPENEKAVMWLLENVFKEVSIPFVIAGKNPSKELLHLTYQNTNTCLVSNPTEKELDELIAAAHINILPSFYKLTGIKIKILNALYNGRHCITNAAAIGDTGLQPMCHIAFDANSFKKITASLFEAPFTKEGIMIRKQLLLPIYNNEQNALQLMQWIY